MYKLVVLCFLLSLTGLTLSIRLETGVAQFLGTNTTGNATISDLSSLNQTYNYTRFFIYEQISPLFFTNLTGTPGRDYVALKNTEGFFLGCDRSGKVKIDSKNISQDNLFVVVVDGLQEKLNLRSWYGGYLGFNQSEFSCNLRKIDNSTEFIIDRKIKLDNLGLNVTDLNETLTLKFDKFYLGSVNNNLIPVETLNKSAVWLSPFQMHMVENFTGPFYFEWLILG